MHRFYDPNIKINATTHQLSEDESKHAIRVLRLQTGDEIGIVDGQGSYFICEVKSADKRNCAVSIKDTYTQPKDKNPIHIAIAPTKQLDRIEWFVEKSTEIGINEISFIRCKNSERTNIKLDRLLRKAVSAMKQSERLYLPKINDMISFDSFIQSHPKGLIAYCGEGDKHQINSSSYAEGNPVLIGPEGDFTPDEVDLAVMNGYELITLGENRLRTETAALYACVVAKTIQ